MNILKNLWIFMALAVLPGYSWALSSDREKPMLIEADRAELDDGKGIRSKFSLEVR